MNSVFVLPGVVVALLATLASAAEKQVPEVLEMRTEYDKKVQADSTQLYDEARTELNAKYGAALERALETAQKAGKLEEAVALKDEKSALAAGKEVPAQDEVNTVGSLKQLRAVYRASLVKIETDRDKRLKPIQDNYAKSLDALVVSLTKSGRLEDAMAVKEELKTFRTNPTVAMDKAPAPEKAEPAPAAAAAPVATKAELEKLFVNKTWVSYVGTDWSFEPRGGGQKRNKTDKTEFSWKHLANNMIQVDDKNGSGDVWYIRFDTAEEASYGKDQEKLGSKLRLK